MKRKLIITNLEQNQNNRGMISNLEDIGPLIFSPEIKDSDRLRFVDDLKKLGEELAARAIVQTDTTIDEKDNNSSVVENSNEDEIESEEDGFLPSLIRLK